mgnify:FL=1
MRQFSKVLHKGLAAVRKVGIRILQTKQADRLPRRKLRMPEVRRKREGRFKARGFPRAQRNIFGYLRSQADFRGRSRGGTVAVIAEPKNKRVCVGCRGYIPFYEKCSRGFYKIKSGCCALLQKPVGEKCGCARFRRRRPQALVPPDDFFGQALADIEYLQKIFGND